MMKIMTNYDEHKTKTCLLVLNVKFFAITFWWNCFSALASFNMVASSVTSVLRDITTTLSAHVCFSSLFIWMRMSYYYYDNCLFLKSLYTLWYLFQFNFLHFVDFSNLSFFLGHSVWLQLVQLREYDLQHWWWTVQVKIWNTEITLEWCWNNDDIIMKQSKNCVLISLI